MMAMTVGFFTWYGEISPFYILFPLHRWICLVCIVVGEAILHETILALRMDPRCPFDCGNPKLSDHSKHFPRNDMVSFI